MRGMRVRDRSGLNILFFFNLKSQLQNYLLYAMYMKNNKKNFLVSTFDKRGRITLWWKLWWIHVGGSGNGQNFGKRPKMCCPFAWFSAKLYDKIFEWSMVPRSWYYSIGEGWNSMVRIKKMILLRAGSLQLPYRPKVFGH